MLSSEILFDTRFGQPIVKDGCGVFGVIRKKSSPEISHLTAVDGISSVKYRGSNLGSGYALFEGSRSERPYRIKAFVRNRSIAKQIEEQFDSRLGSLKNAKLTLPKDSGREQRFGVWEAELAGSDRDVELERTVDGINSALLSGRTVEGRIFSFGRNVNVYKEVGYPLEVAKLTGLDSEPKKADLWLAHTRQPTNSPGTFPIWSHPFASLDCAIVHNGDISSFGANMELLNTWGLKSHVGTDSEVIARLLDHLIRVEGLTVREAATVLTNPFERTISNETVQLLEKYKGARLDGPFTVVAGYSDNEDTYLIALTDRSKFRPIITGEDENCYYIASEESQIRNISKHARIWAPQPGSFFIASLNKGLIESGTTRDRNTQHSILLGGFERARTQEKVGDVVDAVGMDFRAINQSISKAILGGSGQLTIKNVSGQRYIGIGLSTRRGPNVNKFRITIEGFPGNCLANLNDGASFEVFGNAADDVADTMNGGCVIVHGNARDVIGQALQGGYIFVRGAVGNRAAIQMREYQTRKAYLIIGETAEDYLGEYMAGGIVVVLNLSNSQRPVGNYVGTGMIGGTIYIRGKIDESQLGLPPKKEDILNYLKASVIDGAIPRSTFEAISALDYLSEQRLRGLLPQELLSGLNFLFFSGKYMKQIVSEYRKLSTSDRDVLDKLRDFFRAFGIPSSTMNAVLQSEFTVLRAQEEKPERLLPPPQEVPVEE